MYHLTPPSDQPQMNELPISTPMCSAYAGVANADISMWREAYIVNIYEYNVQNTQ